MNKRPKSREETPKEGSDNAEALPHRNNMRPRCTKCKDIFRYFHYAIHRCESAFEEAAPDHFI
jgi:hypothetical protein